MNLDFTNIFSISATASYVTQRALTKWNGRIFWAEPDTGGARIYMRLPSGVVKRDHVFSSTEDMVHVFYIDSDNKLYACTGRGDGKLYERQNGTWAEIVDSNESAINSMIEFGGSLYLGCMTTIREWDGSTLTIRSTHGASECNAIVNYQGVLYAACSNLVGGATQGVVMRSTDGTTWTTDDTHAGTADDKVVADFVEYEGNLLCLTNTNTNPSQIFRITDTTINSWALWFDFSSIFPTYNGDLYTGIVIDDILYIGSDDDTVEGVKQFLTYNGSSWKVIGMPVAATTSVARAFHYESELGLLYINVPGEGIYTFDIRCSQLLGITAANPFSFTLGSCSLLPSNICAAEKGCYQGCVQEGDILELQVKYFGPDTLFLKMYDLNENELFQEQFTSLGSDLYAIEKNENFFIQNLDIVINSVPNQDTIGLSSTTARIAQTFTTTLSGLNYLSIDLLYGTTTGSPDYSITATITPTSGGLPSGSPIGSLNFTPTPSATNTLVFDDISLQNSTVYALVLGANDDGTSPPAAGNAYRVRSVSPGAYAGGTYAFFNGTSWSAIAQDWTMTVTQRKELQQFRMKIEACDSTGSPTTCTVLATSETLKLLGACDCSVLIKYSNDTDFAGLDYENGEVFQRRVEAMFWEPEFEQDRSIYIDSAGTHIPLRQVVQKSLMFKTGFLPPYMHEKLALIFAHTFIEIEGIEYVTDDQYSFTINNDRYLLSKGEVKLKEKRYYKENVL